MPSSDDRLTPTPGPLASVGVIAGLRLAAYGRSAPELVRYHGCHAPRSQREPRDPSSAYPRRVPVVAEEAR